MGKDFVPPMSEYSSQFTVVESVSFNQGQFWNPQNKLIPKLTLVARFDQELAEILKVEGRVRAYTVCMLTMSLEYICIYVQGVPKKMQR